MIDAEIETAMARSKADDDEGGFWIDPELAKRLLPELRQLAENRLLCEEVGISYDGQPPLVQEAKPETEPEEFPQWLLFSAIAAVLLLVLIAAGNWIEIVISEVVD